MLVYKVKNGVNINYYQDALPDDSKYDEVLGSAEISKSMFKRLAAQNTGNYARLLEACYKEQVYNEAVAKTLGSFAPTVADSIRQIVANTPPSNNNNAASSTQTNSTVAPNPAIPGENNV